ncbi:MAG: CCA tRNA nucleotidyltransferase [Candidatus Omnitrophica bacterium]|nr:CCA tRNA nucleotidyltransferase [Candidatus Omnitrophota bacterium]
MIKKESIIKQLNKLPSKLLHVIFLSRNLAKIQKVGVYLVGGFVRDLLLGVENFDLDIVVEKDGIDFAYKLSRILDAHVVKHRAFGTATITKKDGLKIDIATSRKEFYPAPAALPIVSKGSIEDDLFRRDFTINAMACHIDFEKFGQFVDISGGLKDLKEGRIRFLHEGSFIDDPTRIIRAVRFEQRFKFRIDSKTLRFIKQAEKLKMLEKVQKHRNRDEIILIFKERDPYRILRRFKQIYNLTFIDKNIKLSKDFKRIFSSIDKTCIWFQNNFSQRRSLDIWLMYLIVFLHPLSLKLLQQFLNTYAFYRGDTKRIISFKKEFSKIDNNLSKKKLSVIRSHNILHSLSYEVIILVSVMSKSQKTKQRIKDYFLRHHHKKLSITGDDLLSLGIEPGPKFRKIFQMVFRKKINDKIHTREEELEFVKKIINR